MSADNVSSDSVPPASQDAPAKASLFYDPKARAIFYQVALLVAVVWFGSYIWGNLTDNMARQNIRTGFAFLNNISGFDINFHLIDYSRSSTFWQALQVGFLNTLLVSAIGIVLATIWGFTLGIARLSSNWVIARLATAYVETLRNIPLLLQMFFWYFGVLALLPNVKQSIPLPLDIFFNKRGLFFPGPVFSEGFGIVWIALAVAIIASVIVFKWAHKRQDETGVRPPAGLISIAMIVLLPAVAWIATGQSLTFDLPQLKGFNFKGGLHIPPELIAVLWALVLYTATFIAEIVRAGILAVPRGQSEAAQALGLKETDRLNLVVIPQAMRVIVPPLTSQYLNLTKNSSLAVAVGFPDLVSVFMGTTLNQTGQAVEVVLITMLIYLSLSLITSAFMNWFNARIALTER